jgi:1,2-diacylglycerol 3-alpha-glucosyltransferase
MKNKKPIVMISSYLPRLCGIATFCEEAREFLEKANPDRDVLIISHIDGQGDGVFPIIDMSRHDWWKAVYRKVVELNPHVVHLEHEYGLYEYRDSRGRGDGNGGFLELLDAINDYPTIVEPHTIHGWLRDFEANFIYEMCERADVVLFKCHYQKWRLNWTFQGYGWDTPRNIMVVPHGARPDKLWMTEKIPELRKTIGLDKYPYVSNHLVGLVGWIQSNKRWDILISMWEDIVKEIYDRTGVEWDLLAAGTMRDENHKQDYQKYKTEIEILEKKGLAHYYEFLPRGEQYYEIMAICDFIVIPSLDETQSGTLARVMALNKPFITTAPMEGLTAETLMSKGGLLFTTKQMLRDNVIEMACNEDLRKRFCKNLEYYLKNTISWEVVAQQYNEAYELANLVKSTGKKVELPLEF